MCGSTRISGLEFRDGPAKRSSGGISIYLSILESLESRGSTRERAGRGNVTLHRLGESWTESVVEPDRFSYVRIKRRWNKQYIYMNKYCI